MPRTPAPTIPAAARQIKVLMVMEVVESVRLMELDESDFVTSWQSLVGQTEHRPAKGALAATVADALLRAGLPA